MSYGREESEWTFSGIVWTLRSQAASAADGRHSPCDVRSCQCARSDPVGTNVGGQWPRVPHVETVLRFLRPRGHGHDAGQGAAGPILVPVEHGCGERRAGRNLGQDRRRRQRPRIFH